MTYVGQKPANKAITSADIEDGVVSTVDIGDDQVTTDKLANSINSAITANTAKTTNATHSGEVTGATALTIADNIVDEANLKVSNTPTNGYSLTAQSGNTGGLTWASVGGNFVRVGNVESNSIAMNNFMSSSYYNYVIYASIANTGTDNTFINMRFRNSSGGVVSANLNYSFIYTIGDGSTDYDVISQNTTSGNTHRLSVGDDINEQYNYVINITNHQGNNFFYNFTATTENWTNGCSQSIKGGGKFYSDGTNITGIDFLTNAGTSVSGKVSAFAIKTS